MANKIIFDKICIIGLGLIGSSIALAVKKQQISKHISGFAKSHQTRDKALELGFVDKTFPSSIEAVKDSDLVLICTPVGSIGNIAKEIIPYMKRGAIIADAGSVKKSVIDDIRPHLDKGDDIDFIPCHPIAGTENTGPEAGFATLFENRWCIITPDKDTDPIKLEKVKNFWMAIGSQIEIMDAAHHDMVLAITSHIPHLIAYNIVGTVDDLENATKKEVIKFSASGFRDFTRIAASDPTMWRDVFLNNKDAVLDMLGRFAEDLSVLQRAIRDGNSDKLFDMFTRTRKIRRSIIEAGQEIDEPDFGRLHKPKD